MPPQPPSTFGVSSEWAKYQFWANYPFKVALSCLSLIPSLQLSLVRPKLPEIATVKASGVRPFPGWRYHPGEACSASFALCRTVRGSLADKILFMMLLLCFPPSDLPGCFILISFSVLLSLYFQTNLISFWSVTKESLSVSVCDVLETSQSLWTVSGKHNWRARISLKQFHGSFGKN